MTEHITIDLPLGPPLQNAGRSSTSIECLVDFTSDGRIIGVEALDLAAELKLSPLVLGSALAGHSSARYDPLVDGFYFRYLPEQSKRQEWRTFDLRLIRGVLRLAAASSVSDERG